MEKREYLHTDCENVMVWPLWSYIAKDYFKKRNTISSVEFSHSVVSNFLWTHGLQNARLPCPSPIPRVFSNSCPLSQWWHLTISSSVVLFSSYLQSFLVLGSFPVSQLFTSDSQSIGASASVWISYSSEYSGLISFRIHWFYLSAV